MVCKNRGVYDFLCTSWVLITYNICPPVIVAHSYVYGWYDWDRRCTLPDGKWNDNECVMLETLRPKI